MIHAEEAENVERDRARPAGLVESEASRDAYDRGEAVREAGPPWTSSQNTP